MKTVLLPVLLVLATAALTGCRGDDGGNPVPTADSHQPQNPSPYGTGAQETRDDEEAVQADSPNDDGKTPDKDAKPAELPQR